MELEIIMPAILFRAKSLIDFHQRSRVVLIPVYTICWTYVS